LFVPGAFGILDPLKRLDQILAREIHNRGKVAGCQQPSDILFVFFGSVDTLKVLKFQRCRSEAIELLQGLFPFAGASAIDLGRQIAESGDERFVDRRGM
jgi:hypothetical protein